MAATRHRGVMLVIIATALVGCTTPDEPDRVLEPTALPTRAAPPPSDPAPDPISGRAARLEVVTIVNVLEPPLDDLRVRQALALALDPESVPAVGGLDAPTTRFGFDLGRPPVERDLDRARTLLAAYRDDPSRSDGELPGTPVTVRYQCPADPTLHDLTLALISQWERVGAELTHVNPEQHIASVIGHAEPDDADPFVATGSWRGRYQMACWMLPADRPAIDRLVDFVGEQATSPMNVTNVAHPRITEARNALVASPPGGDAHVAVIVDTLEREGVVIWHATTSNPGPAGSSDP